MQGREYEGIARCRMLCCNNVKNHHLRDRALVDRVASINHVGAACPPQHEKAIASGGKLVVILEATIHYLGKTFMLNHRLHRVPHTLL